jgi:predicted nucleic acid-binding Zn ribbon protein
MARELEHCVYKHCKGRGVFYPRTADQRFCSKQCQDDYAYDVRRARNGAVKPRKRRLRTTIATSTENGPFYPIETVSCQRSKPSVYSTPLDLLGRGHRWPNTPSLDRGVWRAILHKEVCGE